MEEKVRKPPECCSCSQDVKVKVIKHMCKRTVNSAL